MKDDDLRDFANQFIQNWQENFAKLGADSQLMELFAGNVYNMQQFYDKSASATTSHTPKPSADDIKWRNLERRLDAIEQKLEKLNAAKTRNKKSGAK